MGKLSGKYPIQGEQRGLCDIRADDALKWGTERARSDTSPGLGEKGSGWQLNHLCSESRKCPGTGCRSTVRRKNAEEGRTGERHPGNCAAAPGPWQQCWNGTGRTDQGAGCGSFRKVGAELGTSFVVLESG